MYFGYLPNFIRGCDDRSTAVVTVTVTMYIVFMCYIQLMIPGNNTSPLKTLLWNEWKEIYYYFPGILLID